MGWVLLGVVVVGALGLVGHSSARANPAAADVIVPPPTSPLQTLRIGLMWSRVEEEVLGRGTHFDHTHPPTPSAISPLSLGTPFPSPLPLPKPQEYLQTIIRNLMCDDAGCCPLAVVVNFTIEAINPLPLPGFAPCDINRKGAWDPLACVGGYFDDTTATGVAAACPADRFSPSRFNCMMQCLEGQTCPGPILNTSMCSPQENAANVSLCPGPGQIIPCPAGSYCHLRGGPAECPQGSYCRSGSENPMRCPLLADCPAGSVDNLINFTLELVIVVVALFILVGLRLLERSERLRQRRVKYSAPTPVEEERLSTIRQKSWNQLGKAAEQTSWSLLTDPPTPKPGTQPWAEARQDASGVRWLVGTSTDDLAYGSDSGTPRTPGTPESPISPVRRKLVPGGAGGAYTAVPQSADGFDMPTRNSAPISITFENLGLTLKSNPDKTIIRGITGTFSPRAVTAIMGPSGTGKTSLLNVILDRAYYGNVRGRVLINGVEGKLRSIRHDVGFVPQDDVMHAALTVREVLVYQAELRLPPSWKRRHILAIVRDTIVMLELEEIADTKVGDIQTRGISGGQRKRVNIGMELVADPRVLVLDEPTSGLDSTSGLRVVEALQKAAHVKGLTVVTVLHQPRFEIFNCFDRLLLLGPGGTTCYEGKTQTAVRHFTKLGYKLPSLMNPADFLMDVVSGVIHPTSGNLRGSLADNWLTESTENRADVPSLTALSINCESSNGGGCDGSGSFAATGDAGNHSNTRRVRSFWSQLLTLCRRNMLLAARSAKLLFLDMFLTLLGAVALGGSHLKANETNTLYSMYTLSAIVLGITTVIASTRILGSGQDTYFREASAGLNRPAHFLAANLVHIPFLLVNSVIYMEALFTLTMPRASYASQYALVWSTVFATSGLGYMVSMLFNPGSYQMAASVIVLISSMLDGANPTRTSSTLSSPFGKILLDFSFARWMAEASVEMEFAAIPDVFFGELADSGASGLADAIVHFGVSPNRNPLMLSCGVLVAFGTTTRLLSYFFMVTFNRGKQK